MVCGLKERWEMVSVPSAWTVCSEKFPLLSEDVLLLPPLMLIVAFSMGLPSFWKPIAHLSYTVVAWAEGKFSER